MTSDAASLGQEAGEPTAFLGQRKARTDVLEAISLAAHSSLQLQVALERTLAALIVSLGCRNAGIVLINWDTQEIEVIAGHRQGSDVQVAFRRFDLLSWPFLMVDQPLPIHLVFDGHSSAPGDSFLALALTSDGQTLGVIAVTLVGERPLPHTAEILSAAGQQVSQAILNCRQYDRTQYQADCLYSANAVGVAIRTSLRMPRLLGKALQELLDVTSLEFAIVHLSDGDDGRYSIVARAGIGGQLAASLGRRYEEWAGKLPQGPATSSGPLVEEDLPPEEDEDRSPRCVMHIPLRSAERTLGFLSIGSYSQRHFVPRAQELFAEIARQTAPMVENARLYEQTQRSARRLAALNAVATAANQNLEVDAFLHTALTKIVEVADLSGASLLLSDEGQSLLAQAARVGGDASSVAKLGLQPIRIAADDREGDMPSWLAPVLREEAVPYYTSAREALGRPVRGSVALLPLRSRDRLLGVLAVAGKRTDLGSDTRDLLQALAGQVAIGLDNALLYHEARRHASELADANEALRAALRGKDQFLANVTHELKRPLAPARLLLETLLEAAPGKLSPRHREELLRNALASLDDLDALVSELLDAVRLERRTQPLARETIDLRAVARRSLAAMSPIARARGLQVNSIIPSTAVHVRGDADALARVMTNLLSNAIKFNREAGSILLQLERTAEGQAVLSVTDTGIGISFQARPHIFERFYQADGSSTREHEGLGLGLYIAKETIAQHGGQIRFDTKEGAGTTFTVMLPLA